jgi:CubicO group peptidase (beta-lactamase class C family)
VKPAARPHRAVLVIGLILASLAVAGCRERLLSSSARFGRIIRRDMDRALVPGLCLTVLDKGRLGPTRAFGVKNRTTREPVSERTIFEGCSLGKPVFAYAVLTLVAEGRFELDRPLVSYVPETELEREFFHAKITDERVRRITARMVLSHRTGFPNWREGETLPLLFDPGARFGYSGEGFVFLQTVVEKITGVRANAFVSQRVFDPLGMTDSSFVWRDAHEARAASPHSLWGAAGPNRRRTKENVAGSLLTTSRDYALFLLALLDGPGLSDELRRETLRSQTALTPGLDWGLGVALETAGSGHYIWHWGDNPGFKCFFLVSREDRSGFVYFANGDSGLSLAPELGLRSVGPRHPAFASDLMAEYPPLGSPVFELARAISRNDLDGGLRSYEKAAAAGPAVRESSLSGVGYALLQEKKADDAVKVFELNARLFPESANVYDSLAEGLEARGDIEAALANYETSLGLNPANGHAAARVKALREESPSAVVPAASRAQQSHFSREALVAETREIVHILEAGHPDPYLFGGGKIAFHRRFQDLLAAIPDGGMDVDDYARLLLPFLAQIGDGHTYLIPPAWDRETGSAVPLELTVIDRSLVVTGVRSPDLKPLLNSRLEAIENVPFPGLAEREKRILPYENEYHNLHRLTGTIGSLERLKLLLPEWKDRRSLRIVFSTDNGQRIERTFPIPPSDEGLLIANPSRVELPSTQRADFAYRFMDDRKRTVLLRIDDMQTYRECHEHWRFYGVFYEDLARKTYERYLGRKAPADRNQVIDALPSATDCFRGLVKNMKRAGAKNLIIDLRRCPGGVSNIAEILMYFIHGKNRTVDVLSESFQVRKYSDVYFQYAQGERFEPANDRRRTAVTINDYDFLEEENYYSRADIEQKKARVRKDLDDMAVHMPTFHKEYAKGEYEAFYTPENVVILSEARTFSSAFWMLQCFYKAGAKLVGVPSGQAPNTFSDQNPYQLKRTGLTLYMTYKYSVSFPKLPRDARVLMPDYVLTYDELKAYGFDPNAAVLLALDVLDATDGPLRRHSPHHSRAKP